ncbi:hypothetical protein [Streptomyces sp. TLI_185]|uniref:hypothetical protein n=1 Tax=Streptomyces sp. TLI_185 TaxID=2485151 RepID=UPI000F4F76ED|nr:hypothetical protein [Streptomyces sp. TLI_185]
MIEDGNNLHLLHLTNRGAAGSELFGEFQYPTAPLRAIKEAVPEATEVADRWHMLQNLSAAIEKT